MNPNARTLLRSSLFATLVAAFVLIAPGSARAQSVGPERALLNRSPEARATDPGRAPWGSAAEGRDPIDGEAALLNQRAVSEARSDQSVPAHATLARSSRDGAVALLNHASL